MFRATFSREVEWVEANVPSQEGKVIVITGANSGIGMEAARVLASKGAKVILACRNEGKARQAIEDLVNSVSEYSHRSVLNPLKIRAENLDFIALDLADLNSVEKFAQELAEKYPKIDCLICNAGVMPAKREETAQGFEMQMGVNVFGHYALICRLVPILANSISEGSAPPRIVMLSSNMHKAPSRINFEDIDRKQKYSAWDVYGETKLADLLLMHKFAELYPQFVVTGCHPGYSATNFLDGTGLEFSMTLFGQSALMGSLPTVMAAVDPSIKTNEYCGPYWGPWGVPYRTATAATAKNQQLADTLFRVCEEKTGVTPNKI